MRVARLHAASWVPWHIHACMAWAKKQEGGSHSREMDSAGSLGIGNVLLEKQGGSRLLQLPDAGQHEVLIDVLLQRELLDLLCGQVLRLPCLAASHTGPAHLAAQALHSVSHILRLKSSSIHDCSLAHGARPPP